MDTVLYRSHGVKIRGNIFQKHPQIRGHVALLAEKLSISAIGKADGEEDLADHFNDGTTNHDFNEK